MGLRERLQSKARPTAAYPVAIVDTRAAEHEMAAAAAELQLLTLTGETEGIKAARERFEAARTALAACFETIIFTALPPEEFERMIDEDHPPREDTDDEAWNIDTFPKACFLACAPKELDEGEWEEWLIANVNDGERTVLYNTAVEANLRVPNPNVPKGLAEILS